MSTVTAFGQQARAANQLYGAREASGFDGHASNMSCPEHRDSTTAADGVMMQVDAVTPKLVDRGAAEFLLFSPSGSRLQSEQNKASMLSYYNTSTSLLRHGIDIQLHVLMAQHTIISKRTRLTDSARTGHIQSE
ncbi:hypothetical protein MKX08_006838 [Trichoderma sp. CBMAI-0020]|nr:hypothetical protein MKX08_006838 [Trichoderma sp. CBMAI-0020]